MNKAIFIDAKNKKISSVEYKDIEDIEQAVGGVFTMGRSFPTGETLYVNDNGLLDGTKEFFYLEGSHQPFAGNGLIVGKEIIDAEGDLEKMDDVETTLEDIIRRTSFLTKKEALALTITY